MIAGILIYGAVGDIKNVCIGASIAICGVMGGYCVSNGRNTVLTIFAFMNIGIDLYLVINNVQDVVAHLGHVIGFICGIMYYKFFIKTYDVI